VYFNYIYQITILKVEKLFIPFTSQTKKAKYDNISETYAEQEQDIE